MQIPKKEHCEEDDGNVFAENASDKSGEGEYTEQVEGDEDEAAKETKKSCNQILIRDYLLHSLLHSTPTDSLFVESESWWSVKIVGSLLRRREFKSCVRYTHSPTSTSLN